MTNEEIFIRLVSALILGMLVGFERILNKHEAGVRTHGIVSMGAALFVITGIVASIQLNTSQIETIRIIGQIVAGIGFLGAGLIFINKDGNKKKGLTSAATLWTTSGVGAACGFGLIYLASLATFLTLFTLVFMSSVEWGFVKMFKK